MQFGNWDEIKLDSVRNIRNYTQDSAIQLFFLGGIKGEQGPLTDQVEMWSSGENKWEKLASLSAAKHQISLVSTVYGVLAIGGEMSSEIITGKVEHFENGQRWIVKPDRCEPDALKPSWTLVPTKYFSPKSDQC